MDIVALSLKLDVRTCKHRNIKRLDFVFADLNKLSVFLIFSQNFFYLNLYITVSKSSSSKLITSDFYRFDTPRKICEKEAREFVITGCPLIEDINKILTPNTVAYLLLISLANNTQRAALQKSM